MQRRRGRTAGTPERNRPEAWPDGRDAGAESTDVMDETIGYADAMAELDGILDELERDDLDVDVLAERVKRASELIKFCRTRIARAQDDVDKIVVDLEAFGAAPVDEDDEDDG
jgi:exodeoxyribonuclease VII small subunit